MKQRKGRTHWRTRRRLVRVRIPSGEAALPPAWPGRETLAGAKQRHGQGGGRGHRGAGR